MSNALKWRHRLFRPAWRCGGGGGLGRVAVQPAGHVVVVQLLAPQHPGERLPHHHRLVGAGPGRGQLAVELVGLGPAGLQGLFESGPQRVRACGRGRGPQPQPELRGLAGRHGQLVPERALGPRLIRVDGRRPADHVVVDAVLGVRGGARRAVQPLGVGLVLAEQQGRTGAVRAGRGGELQLAEEGVADRDRVVQPTRPGRGAARRGPRTRCSGTTRSAGRAGWPARDRHWSPRSASGGHPGPPSRNGPRLSSTAHNRKPRCRSARIRAGAGPGPRSARRGPGRDRRTGDSGNASGSTSGWGWRPGTTSIP